MNLGGDVTTVCVFPLAAGTTLSSYNACCTSGEPARTRLMLV